MAIVYPLRMAIGLSLLASLLLLGACDKRASTLSERGVKTNAQLAFKRIKMGSAGRGSSRQYTFTLYYFHLGPDQISKKEERKAANKAMWEDSTLDINEKLNNWELGAVELGDFTSVDLVVSKEVYNRHQEGERIEIYYLPEDPEVVLPAEMVED